MEVSKRYALRGVSAAKDEVHKAIKNINKGLFPKAFCKIVPDYLTGDDQYCLVMHADGAGTKSALAYMYWKTTGDLSVWKGIAQDALIMNIDDLLCVGAVDNIMLSSTIGRNKNLIPAEVISAIINGTEELINELANFGVHIHSTGGETADVGDLVRTIIVDSTVTARMERGKVIDNANIKAGNVIVGLASYGQATYETSYNGGMGSNGLTSARHDVFNKSLANQFPDMTTEGSFPLGGAVAVTLITQGVNPFLATLAAVGAGCLAGMATGLLYTKGKIPTLLSGILVMTSCHSIMLMIMGRANLGLLGTKQIQDVLPFDSDLNQLLTGFIFVALVIGLMLFFLDTKLGQAYIATGDNPDMARSFGIHTGRMELMGLVLSNGIIALAGALIAQQEGYADVSRGIGVIVVGLASLIIGEVLFKSLTLAERLMTIVVGSIAYQFLVWGVIALGFNTSYLRLYSALILAVCLMIPTFKSKYLKGVKFSK